MDGQQKPMEAPKPAGKPAPKISAEIAAEEFDRWAECWDIDTETGAMGEDERGAFATMRARMERKIRSGALTIDPDGNPHFTPAFGDQAAISFSVPKGAEKLTWDKYKERETNHRIFATLAAMTGLEPSAFSKLDGRDLKVCEAIALFYLGS